MPATINRHDGLHPTPENGIKYCWCLKPCCWLPGTPTMPRNQSGRFNRTATGGGRRTGSCICRDCPCPHEGPKRTGSILGISVPRRA